MNKKPFSESSLAQAMAADRKDFLDLELARAAGYFDNYGYFNNQGNLGSNAKASSTGLTATQLGSLEQAKQLEERYKAEEERRMLREKLVTFKEHYKIARLSNPVLTHEAAIQYVKLIEEEAQTLTIDDVR